jgi:hypothetical protein
MRGVVCLALPPDSILRQRPWETDQEQKSGCHGRCFGTSWVGRVSKGNGTCNLTLIFSSLGAGLLALLVPRGFRWGHSRLFGLFA